MRQTQIPLLFFLSGTGDHSTLTRRSLGRGASAVQDSQLVYSWVLCVCVGGMIKALVPTIGSIGRLQMERMVTVAAPSTQALKLLLLFLSGLAETAA